MEQKKPQLFKFNQPKILEFENLNLKSVIFSRIEKRNNPKVNGKFPRITLKEGIPPKNYSTKSIIKQIKEKYGYGEYVFNGRKKNGRWTPKLYKIIIQPQFTQCLKTMTLINHF